MCPPFQDPSLKRFVASFDAIFIVSGGGSLYVLDDDFKDSSTGKFLGNCCWSNNPVDCFPAVVVNFVQVTPPPPISTLTFDASHLKFGNRCARLSHRNFATPRTKIAETVMKQVSICHIPYKFQIFSQMSNLSMRQDSSTTPKWAQISTTSSEKVKTKTERHSATQKKEENELMATATKVRNPSWRWLDGGEIRSDDCSLFRVLFGGWWFYRFAKN